MVADFLETHPVTAEEEELLLPQNQISEKESKDKGSSGLITSPLIPPPPVNSDLLRFRQTLPVYKLKPDILKACEENQVILVAGETGSGKTTQVPQLILESCWEKKQPCQIICTQPRRLAAISVSERVATERAERLGGTVGYQVRLDTKTSQKTILTFCTTGVLLRTIMGGASSLGPVTHIIVDEVHERDRFTDFLLLVLKEALPQHKHLRLILMSATLNMELFSGYFDNCPVVCVPGNLYPVEEFFLEDVLKMTGFKNPKNSKLDDQTKKDTLNEWFSKQMNQPAAEACSSTEEESDMTVSDTAEIEEENVELEFWVTDEMNRMMQDTWLTGDQSIFPQILHLISSENISVDYLHPETNITPLMIAASRGFTSVVEHLLCNGADINIKSSNGWTALDFAKNFNQNEAADLMEAHSLACALAENVTVKENFELITDEDRQLLTSYQQTFDDEKVDIKLVTKLIQKIYSSDEPGGILVFLPGYDDIISLKYAITENARFEHHRYVIYLLHSSLQHSDQKRVFKNPPKGVRKIVLSTNIAETSITINDIVFVIDCGKVKEKTFDALSSFTMLKSHWISKASALQRKGRAGRCQAGKCYHLFSRPRYVHLQDFQTAEILRLPLQELCLQSKLIISNRESIVTFLGKCPEAPPQLVIQNAIQILKRIEALDDNEDLTHLGQHLADLPVDPRLGKMLLHSVVMKCLDPILTIVCTMSMKDPFVIPSLASQKRAVKDVRKKFAEDTHSDHMVLLRAFQLWQKAKVEGWERAFCDKHFISSATMEMLAGMRMQIMGQLKVSGFVRGRGAGDIRDLNTNSDNWALVKACLVAGSYPNIIRISEELALNTEKERSVKFHHISVLQLASPIANLKSKSQWERYLEGMPSKWYIYEEMTRMGSVSLAKCLSMVSTMAVIMFAGPSRLADNALSNLSDASAPATEEKVPGENSQDEEEEESEDGPIEENLWLSLDQWLKFEMEDTKVAELTMQVRLKWHSLFLNRMKNPHKAWTQPWESFLQVMIMLLMNAEKNMGLTNPINVGQRPRAIGGNGEEFYQHGGPSHMHQHQNQHGYNHHQHQHHNQHNRHQQHHHQHQHQQHQHQHQFMHQLHRHQAQSRFNNFNQPYVHQVQGNSRGFNQQQRFDFSAFAQQAALADINQGSSGDGNSSQGKHSGSATNKAAQSAATHSNNNRNSQGRTHSDSTCHFFLMKCNNRRKIVASQKKSLWSTAIENEDNLNTAFESGKPVMLIFTSKGSDHYHGYARMTSLIGNTRKPEFDGPNLTCTFGVRWEERTNLPYHMTSCLVNQWNDKRKLNDNTWDGQQVDPNTALVLFKLWERMPAEQKNYHGPGYHHGKQQSGWGGNRGHGGRSHGRHNRNHAGKGGKDDVNN